MPPTDPAVCLFWFAGGVIGIIWELIEIGSIFPGSLGLLLTLFASYGFTAHRPELLGQCLLAASVALFLMEAVSKQSWLFGILATATVAAGFSFLFASPRRIEWFLALPISVSIGFVTTFLLCLSKRARRNKWRDLANY